MKHLAMLPILIPLLTGALLLLLERHHRMRVLRVGAWIGMAALLASAIALLLQVHEQGMVVYLLGDWPARLGIALMVDRLSVMMVLTTTLLAIPCLMHACAGWDQRALHFHTLFQLQLMGLNGAFLTGDVFNLFVFFEVMLISSYGLLLSGARGPRIRAGMHYAVFNIAASTLFLIALGLLYGMLGTLNMAEMALRIANASAQDAGMLRAGLGLLLVVFCAKAALLPLYLWLPEAYARAPVAVAALFTIMTKVGLYAVLRISSLMLGPDAGALAGFASGWLLPAGAATLVLAALGVVGAPRLRIGIAYLVLLSAGTLFVAFAIATSGTISAGLYYLPHSAFVTAALFLIADLVQRHRVHSGDYLMPISAMADKTLPAFLYMVAAVSVIGLPPLSGFVGKLMLLSATPQDRIALVWTVILASSLMVLIGMSRAGTQLFWRVEPAPKDLDTPTVRRIEIAAIVVLLGYGIAMTLAANPILAYTRATAEQLLAPAAYIEQVLGTTPQLRRPSP
ncbi:monovalent cation/H+ antiporter subunit D [Luteimonas sp. RIT-PG2_3]